MAEIELVVRIPEGLKKDFEVEQWTALTCMEMKDALMNSTPLPKGHGGLIDANELYNSLKFPTQQFALAFKQVLDDAPTIIEADKAGEGDESGSN